MSDEYRLIEDIWLLNGVVNDALYQALRYYATGYDHKRDDVLDDIEDIRDLADEVLERERDEKVTSSAR